MPCCMLSTTSHPISHAVSCWLLAATRHVVHWIARGMTRRSYATNMQWAQWGRALDSSRVVPRHIVHTIQVELRTTQHAVQCSIRSHERRPIVYDCTHACIQLDWLAWRARRPTTPRRAVVAVARACARLNVASGSSSRAASCSISSACATKLSLIGCSGLQRASLQQRCGQRRIPEGSE